MKDDRKAALEALDGLESWISFVGDRVDALAIRFAQEKITAIRRALEAPAVPEWQPIETAPKDSTRILLARIAPVVDTDGLAYGSEAWKERMFSGEPTKIHLWWATTGFWSDKWNNWNDGVEPSGLADPTHWMPLPPPPTEPGENDD